MALKPENPVVGGTVLRRAAIQSPGYVAGSAGWTINQDGSVEFNNGTFRGTLSAATIIGGTITGSSISGGTVSGAAITGGSITGSNLVLYTSGTTPIANGLLLSVVGTAYTDTAGNSVLAGSTFYGKSGLTYYAINQATGADASGTFGALLTVYTGSAQSAWTAGAQLNLSASNHLSLLGDVQHLLGITGAPQIDLHSGSALLSKAAVLSANAQGVLTIADAAGLSGQVPSVQVDISTSTAGNDANPHAVTKAWSIPAGDAVAGTTYTIKGLLRVNTGQTTIETLTLGVDLNAGTRTALATLGTAFNGGALNTVYSIPFELTLIADEIGADNPGIYLQAVLADESANRLATNSANMNGHTDAATFTKANANTIAVYAQWGGAGGSAQNAHTTSSRLYREGP